MLSHTGAHLWWAELKVAPRCPLWCIPPVESSLSGRRSHEYRDIIPLIRLLIWRLWDKERLSWRNLAESGTSEALSGNPRETASRRRRGASCGLRAAPGWQPARSRLQGRGTWAGIGRARKGTRLVRSCHGQSWKKSETLHYHFFLSTSFLD